ncbi:MAG TPA: C4-type zinc ribbon domain-containing protein [Bacteroidales bacterium]|nr:C4-type zinc ribbon domain-containing protein [Bacteroidales bacterium]
MNKNENKVKENQTKKNTLSKKSSSKISKDKHAETIEIENDEVTIVKAKTITVDNENVKKTKQPSITKKDKKEEDKAQEISIEKKLVALYNLQQIDSEIDKIRIIRGELPLEVQDLEDEIAGLETRINNFQKEIENLQEQLKEKQNAIIEHKAMIKKYETQQMNVRNNREYEALSKEIEFQNLEIQLCEKRIKEFTGALEVKKEAVQQATKKLEEKKADLKVKKTELEDIVSETEKEEKALIKKSEELQSYIEPRLLNAYIRIRGNARNGLAVVAIERDACGGCFSKIPPQRHLDIRMHKKIIVCEYCGRILVDEDIVNTVKQ